MKKSLLATLLFVVSATTAFGQFAPPIDTVFTENFDGTLSADSIAANYNTDSTNATRSWNDTTFLKTTGTRSFHTQIYANDSIIFETDAFTTVGYTNVRFTFDQICKIRFIQKAFIQMSRDNGATWVNMTGTHYQGESPQFASQGWFNELSYPSALLSPYWVGPTVGNNNSGTTPTNSWWARETFDLSSYLGIYDSTNSQYGYSNCRIRFVMTNKTGTPSPNALAGWFVDNIMVEGAPCELDPPTIDWINVNPVAKPEGARYMPTQDVRFKGEDNLGVDSSRIYFRRYDYSSSSWSSWTDSLMTPSSTSSCPTASNYVYSFGNIDINDSIEWYVRIFDCACPNVVRSPLESDPDQTFKFWREPSLPPICGTTTQTTFPFSTTLPYSEDFENAVYWTAGTGPGTSGVSHRGNFPEQNPPNGKNYTVIPNEQTIGYAWSIRTGATSTAQSGPSGDASTSGNGKYIYTESDQGSNNSITHLKLPCTNLSSYACALLEFDYHMYGSQINKLQVSIDTGFNTSIWTNLDEIVGQQQTKTIQDWKTYSISLKEYTGDFVRLRFTGKRGVGPNGDISIDNVRVYEPATDEIALREVFNPKNGYCSYSNNELLDLWIQSNGCNTADSVPVTWTYDYTNLQGNVSTVSHTEYITQKSLELGDSTLFTFGTGPDLSGYGSYDLSIYVSQPGDTVNSNDTIGPYKIIHEEPFSSFPYVLDFDDTNTVAGNNTPFNSGTFSNTVFTPQPAGNSGNYAFMVGTKFTPTVGSGPLKDKSGTGNYLVAEGDYGTSPASATLVSNCIDLGSMANPVLQFRHHMYGADIGAMRVQWIKDGENTWSNPMPPFTTKLTDEKDNWSFYELDLSAQAGNIIKLRFIAQKSGFGIGADIAFDDIAIFDKSNVDLGIDHVIAPGNRVNLTGGPAGKRVKLEVRNFGDQTQSNVPISYTVTPTCGLNAGVSTTYTFTHSGSIAPGATVTATDATNTVTWPTGTFEIYAWTGKSNDNHSWNDSAYTFSAGWPETYIQNGFVEDFESCTFGDSSGFFATGDLKLWESGSINSLGGNNGYGTNLNSNVPGGLEEILFFPRFIGFDTIAGAELRITHDIDFGTGDAGLIEFLAGGNWNTVGFWDPQNVVGTNWYNTGTSSLNDAWVGNIGQQTSIWPLANWNFSSAPLILRARYNSVGGNSDGWNIDRVEVYIPPQNSAAPVNVTTVEYLPIPDQNNHIKTYIKNTGAKILDSCIAEYSIDGGVTWTAPEKVVFNPPLIPRKGAWYEFNAPWVNPASGVSNVCVRTSLPDNKPDNFTADDLICANITVLDKIDMSTDSSYCNNFDDPAVDPWLTLNAFVKDGTTLWEVGTPNNAPLISTNSGSNAWVTDLDSNYKKRDSSALYTPVFAIDSGEVYSYEFMHAFSTEIYHDGGTVDVTFDGGITWYTVGTNLFGATWFNTSFVTSLDVYKPGWTGLSNGWVQAKINMSVDTARNAVFRFRFGSDETINKAGWAIDDFCFYVTDDPGRVYVVGEEELERHIGVGNIHPNPTTGYAQLPISFQQEADVTISIRNTQGQLMMTQSVHGDEGINTFPIETSGWAAGMYLVETVTPFGTDVQRLIVE
jgi:hypothetical protein